MAGCVGSCPSNGPLAGSTQSAACDVLELGRAEVGDRHVEPAAHLAVGVLGEADRARTGDPFEPRGDVDAVAHQVAVALLDNIAEMDADAKFDALSGGNPALRSTIPLCTSIAQRTASTTLRNSMMSVGGAFDNAAMMQGDGRVDQVAAQRPSRASVRSSSTPVRRLNPTHQPPGSLLSCAGHTTSAPRPMKGSHSIAHQSMELHAHLGQSSFSGPE